MTPHQWERARAIFQRALEQPDARRAAFLSDSCEGDETIRCEVESLMAAHVAAGRFLDTPAFRVPRDVAEAPSLGSGDRIGTFDVLGVLGSGGMGEVYRARDASLGREVAIKVLPRAVAADPQRLARFDRESRILATLNHPHIAAIHSVEQFGDLRCLVLELVEGPTLADRLRTGPLALDEALAVARELAGALEAAHERSIVHRDLKPANIKLATSSGVKLLDFGLAKEHIGHDVVPAGPVGSDGTTDGLILGTCAYMSPEQARGKPVDKRTDIWAFGCVLFEMLAGTRAFPGDSPSDTIAAVLEREPDWSRLPAGTPPIVRHVLRRCLEKDPNRRLHDVADARIEIENALSGAEEPSARIRRPTSVTTLAGWLALLVAGIALGVWLQSRAVDRPASPMTRFTWVLPDGLGLDSPPTVSPDGRLIAFTARTGRDDPSRLHVRPLAQLSAQPLQGTEGAKQPFWSPDGRSIAYFARGRLMKIALDGGAPIEICAAPDGRGGTWSAAGTIVFSPLLIESGLMRVSANGGNVEPATLLDVQQGENSHRWPVFLPDGVHFLYFVRALGEERRGVYLGRIDRPASTPGTPLFRSASEALFAPVDGDERGVLLTVEAEKVVARPFDARTRRVTGDPRTLDLPSAGNTLYHPMMLNVSPGVLAYAASSVPYGRRFASVGRNGEDLTVSSDRESQGWPRLSSDGRRLAFARIDPAPGRTDVWVEDLVRGTRVRLMGTPTARLPVWSPDGERLAYIDGSLQRGTLSIAAADGTGSVSTLGCPGLRCDPTDWSQDGRWLLVTVYTELGRDVWLVPTESHDTARPLLTQPFHEYDARFSPDGHLVAYVSEETGRPEVSVQSVDGPPRREVISVAGGTQPVWSRNRRELFFVDPEGLLRSAPVSMDPGGRPVLGNAALLAVPPIGIGHWSTQYDVSPDGRRIYFLDRQIEPPPSEIGVVVGWPGMLK